MTRDSPRGHKAKKTDRRLFIIEGVIESLGDPEVLAVIDRERWSESRISTYMHLPLVQGLERRLNTRYSFKRPETSGKKARNAIRWETERGVHISPTNFLGMTHRPDFIVEAEEFTIAVEMKRGDSGAAIRKGIGQSLIYSTDYDFVVCCNIDASGDMGIKAAIDGPSETRIRDTLWERFNVRIEVV